MEDPKPNRFFLNSEVEKALVSYLDAKGLDFKTKEKYLEFFHKFANVQGELTQENIDTFLKHNNNSPSRAMLSHLLKAVRRWTFPVEMVGVISQLDIPERTGKREKKIPLSFTLNQLDYLMENWKGDSITDERNKLSILTQWWAGLRITELLSITLNDLETLNYDKVKGFQKIKVNYEGAKFKKERYVTIPTEVYFRITQYIVKRSQISQSYASKINSGENIWGFSNSAYDKLIREKTLKVLGRAYNTHSLRHGRADDLRQKGFTIEEIKEILGHADISSTQVYFKVTQKEIDSKLELDKRYNENK